MHLAGYIFIVPNLHGTLAPHALCNGHEELISRTKNGAAMAPAAAATPTALIIYIWHFIPRRAVFHQHKVIRAQYEET